MWQDAKKALSTWGCPTPFFWDVFEFVGQAQKLYSDKCLEKKRYREDERYEGHKSNTTGCAVSRLAPCNYLIAVVADQTLCTFMNISA